MLLARDSATQQLLQHYRRWHTANYPISDKVVWHACRESAKRAGVNKPLHPHTLRHHAASPTMPHESVSAALVGLSVTTDAA